MITDIYDRLPLDAITIERDERQRRQIKVDDLVDSIRARGVLQPIIVRRQDDKIILVFGERRLTASRVLSLPDIPVRFLDSLDPIELQIIELEENLKRQDLDWQDQVRAIARIHRLYEVRDPTWTFDETGTALGVGKGHVSLCLKVDENLDDSAVSSATTMREAYNLLNRRRQRAAGEALNELTGIGHAMVGEAIEATATGEGEVEPQEESKAEVSNDAASPAAPRPERPTFTSAKPTLAYATPVLTPPERMILNESFLQWAPRYQGTPFNFIHCDFPYGIEAFGGSGQFTEDAQAKYSDKAQDYFALLECLLVNFNRLCSPNAHIMFWHSAKHLERTRAMFREAVPTLEIFDHPLVWVKSDNAGISADTNRRPRHVYETALLGVRAGRNILSPKADAFVAPTDKKRGPSVKPEPVLRHFFSMLVDSTTRMLDPTCGSATALLVAEEFGAKQILGMDTNETMVGQARSSLRAARTLRAGSKLAAAL